MPGIRDRGDLARPRPRVATQRHPVGMAPVSPRPLDLHRSWLDLGVGLCLGRDSLPLRNLGVGSHSRLGMGAGLCVGSVVGRLPHRTELRRLVARPAELAASLARPPTLTPTFRLRARDDSSPPSPSHARPRRDRGRSSRQESLSSMSIEDGVVANRGIAWRRRAFVHRRSSRALMGVPTSRYALRWLSVAASAASGGGALLIAPVSVRPARLSRAPVPLHPVRGNDTTPTNLLHHRYTPRNAGAVRSRVRRHCLGLMHLRVRNFLLPTTCREIGACRRSRFLLCAIGLLPVRGYSSAASHSDAREVPTLYARDAWLAGRFASGGCASPTRCSLCRVVLGCPATRAPLPGSAAPASGDAGE